MSDESETRTHAADTGGPTPGELLQRQRENAGLTLERAAQDLHLDTWVIEAIETNRFSALGAPVFARGHLRKYAAMLGIPPEEVLRRYERIANGDDAPSLIPAAHGSVPAPSTGLSRWLLIVLALLVVGGVAAWWWLAPDMDRNAEAVPQESGDRPPAGSGAGESASGGENVLRPAPTAPLPEVLQQRPPPAADGTSDTGASTEANTVPEAPDPAR